MLGTSLQLISPSAHQKWGFLPRAAEGTSKCFFDALVGLVRAYVRACLCARTVPYEKGFNLLYAIQKRVGDDVFEVLLMRASVYPCVSVCVNVHV